MPNHHHHLPPIETLAPLLEASFQSLQSLMQYTQPSIQEVTVEGIPVHAGLSETTKCYIREVLANLRAICAAKTLNCLPLEMRQIIRAAVEERVVQEAPSTAPEVIIRSSTIEPCNVIVPPSRLELIASMWTHITHEMNKTGFMKEFHKQFPELRICDFIESINDALRAPVLTELRNPSQNPGWNDDDNDLEHIKNELMVELGRDVSESQTGYTHFYLTAPLQLHRDNDFPASIEGFNLLTALVIAALDCGVEDQQGNLKQAGVTPLSWFCLTSVILGAVAHGALQSGGCMKKPPLTEFYDLVLQISQNHIEKVVQLKAAATYQITMVDVQGLTDMVLEDMSRQLYTHMTTDPDTHRGANQCSLDRLFVEAQKQLGPFMDEWKFLYKHSLVQALKESEEDREESPENLGYIKLFAYNHTREICESIAHTMTDPILDGDEITCAYEQIRLDHAEEIEEAQWQTRAEISSEKKAWAVTYCNSNKLQWLTKAAEELGYVLVSKDNVEEREGRLAKYQLGTQGKHNRSGSQVKCAAPDDLPTTPTNQPCKLDQLKTPKAQKTKGKRPITIPLDVNMAEIRKPLFFASSYPETAKVLGAVVTSRQAPLAQISNITVPKDVRASQAPEVPIREPPWPLLEPDMDVSVYAASHQATPAHMAPTHVEASPPSWVLTPNLTRGVASSMHNPDNVMVDNPQETPSGPPEEIVVPPVLPNLAPIPLLLGLAEMLNTLQANLLTSFTSQINVLSVHIDAQDELIKITPTTLTKKGKAVPQPTAAPTMTPDLALDSTASPPGLTEPTQGQEALPVPPPPPTPPRSTHPPHAILPEKATWAGIITPANFAQNINTKTTSCTNTNIIS
ncbi:hypothetical protein BJY52DRAFT_1194962 [Lactarius psammicola]|nr:hypothetical protein BJY52DRAFT_1194962 [Lactarius psammicola]